MQLPQPLLKPRPGTAGCFENRQHLARPLGLALPAVDGIHPRQQVHTGGQLRFHQGRANLAGLFQIRERAEDDEQLHDRQLMRNAFFDKLIKRMDRLDPGEVQHLVLDLLQEKGLLEKVFQALQEGVILLDPGGHVTYVNRAACQLFGVEGGQLIGKQLGQGLRGFDWPELLKPGTVVSRDLEVFYPENRCLNFYITAIDDEQPLGFVMLIRDITQTRRLTEEKIESERISALTMLAAGVAHELGNPLNSLTIHLQLLERKIKKMGASGEKLREHLDVATGEIRRLDAIITQFLAAIRPCQPQLQRSRINDLVQESVRFLKPDLDQAKIEAVLDLHPDIPPMPLDAAQMKQAFYNLIRNAAQAMPQGGRLAIASSFTDFEVRVSFEDTGRGISAENMGSLFQPFFTTRRTGTGLGLLIVRRIIREHGGDIDIESREGQGTRVSIYLPLVERKIRLLEAPAAAPPGTPPAE